MEIKKAWLELWAWLWYDLNMVGRYKCHCTKQSHRKMQQHKHNTTWKWNHPPTTNAVNKLSMCGPVRCHLGNKFQHLLNYRHTWKSNNTKHIASNDKPSTYHKCCEQVLYVWSCWLPSRQQVSAFTKLQTHMKKQQHKIHPPTTNVVNNLSVWFLL